MRGTWLNFPWVGNNPYKIAGAFSLLFLVVFAPQIIFLAIVEWKHHPGMMLLPIACVVLVGPFVFAIAYFVAVKMRHLRERNQDTPDLRLESDGLIVKGFIQSPGIVQIRGDDLVLIPMFGKAVTIPLLEVRIQSATGRTFNGTMMMGAAGGIWLSSRDFWRLGFAVPHANKWREVLEGNPIEYSFEDYFDK